MKVFDLNALQPQNVSGLYQRTLAQGQNLSVARLNVRKGAITQPHSHKHEEIIVLLQGSWAFHFPGKDVTLQPNQVLTIAPGVEHSSEVLEDVVAIDVCTPTREDWIRQEDRTLHTDEDQFLWAV
jgi:quercetin dioxygenase-like cupin family protein